MLFTSISPRSPRILEILEILNFINIKSTPLHLPTPRLPRHHAHVPILPRTTDNLVPRQWTRVIHEFNTARACGEGVAQHDALHLGGGVLGGVDGAEDGAGDARADAGEAVSPHEDDVVVGRVGAGREGLGERAAEAAAVDEHGLRVGGFVEGCYVEDGDGVAYVGVCC